MKNKVLILFGEKDIYMKKLENLLKRKNIKLNVVYSANKKNCKKKFDVKQKYYDYIFCFRSKYILKKNDIKKSKNPPINFHPGSPEYRGFGCANYALYENSKNYGVTTHIISEKIDNGKIIDVKRFSISANDNLETLLKKTYKLLYTQARKLIINVLNNGKILNELIKKNKNEKWSKRIKSKKDLNNFYEIDLNSNKIEFKKKIRATKFKNFKPFVIFHGEKFILD
tara:strand:+ start:878 stop:1555 length:678 start_codon:yes stop_codon:yes gene_type:complete